MSNDKELLEKAKKELKQEELKKKKKEMEERDKRIKDVQKKKKKTADDKVFLQREMLKRAKDNTTLPRDLEKLYPSQMTLEEMIDYLNGNNARGEKIPYQKGDSTVILRARIKAFRNPGYQDRLKMLENRKIEGKIIR